MEDLRDILTELNSTEEGYMAFRKEVMSDKTFRGLLQADLGLICDSQVRKVLMGCAMAKFPRQSGLEDVLCPMRIVCQAMMTKMLDFQQVDEEYFDFFRRWLKKDKQVAVVKPLLMQYFDCYKAISRLTGDSDRDQEVKDYLTQKQEVIEQRLSQFKADTQLYEWKNRIRTSSLSDQEDPDKMSLTEVMENISTIGLTGFEFHGGQTEVLGKRLYWESYLNHMTENKDGDLKQQYKQLVDDTILTLQNVIPLGQWSSLLDDELTGMDEGDELVAQLMFELQKCQHNTLQGPIDRWLEEWNELVEMVGEENDEARVMLLLYGLRSVINRAEQVAYFNNLVNMGSQEF